MRNSVDEWYKSLTAFHTSLIGKGRLPTVDDLKESQVFNKGWLWKAMYMIGDVDETNPYDRERWIRIYNHHNESVVNYFRFRRESLLVLNLADKSANNQLADFLGLPPEALAIPHATSYEIVHSIKHDGENYPEELNPR